MMFALNQMFWLGGVFLWTNRTSVNINVLWTNRTSFNINVSEFKSFNKTIVYFWYRLASYLSTQEVIITSAVDFGNYHFFWVDKSSCQPYQKSLIVHNVHLRWYHTLQVKFDLLVYFFYFVLAVCLNISTVINIKMLTNSIQQTQSYQFTSHITAFLSVVLITEMLEICIQTLDDQNVQLILKSYLPVVYGAPLNPQFQQRFKYIAVR